MSKIISEALGNLIREKAGKEPLNLTLSEIDAIAEIDRGDATEYNYRLLYKPINNNKIIEEKLKAFKREQY